MLITARLLNTQEVSEKSGKQILGTGQILVQLILIMRALKRARSVVASSSQFFFFFFLTSSSCNAEVYCRCHSHNYIETKLRSIKSQLVACAVKQEWCLISQDMNTST